jgi:hypothetical protein
LSRGAADVLEVVRVRVETMLPAAVTAIGAKLHVASAGRPEQVNEMVEFEEKPFSGVTVTVSVPLLPAVTARDAGATANAKSVAGALAVVVALA